MNAAVSQSHAPAADAWDDKCGGENAAHGERLRRFLENNNNNNKKLPQTKPSKRNKLSKSVEGAERDELVSAEV